MGQRAIDLHHLKNCNNWERVELVFVAAVTCMVWLTIVESGFRKYCCSHTNLHTQKRAMLPVHIQQKGITPKTFIGYRAVGRKVRVVRPL